MTSQPKAPAKKGGWGSLLSGAVAGLESRLDTILADESEGSVRSRAAEQDAKPATSQQQPQQQQPQQPGSGTSTGPVKLAPARDAAVAASREPSRSRANERLAERLAKAASAKTTPAQTGSAVPSRVATPVAPDSARSSVDLVRQSVESTRPAVEIEVSREVPEIGEPKTLPEIEEPKDAVEQPAGSILTEAKQEEAALVTTTAETGTLLASALPINPAKVSFDSPRPSVDTLLDNASSRASSELANGTAARGGELDAELARVLKDHAESESQRQEEMQVLLEKVDALQSKLQYLVKETVAAAKEANATTSAGSDGRKLAEKDEKIALLMQEGEKLSKTELRHLQTIKKLRAKSSDDEKVAAEAKKRLDRLERSESDLKAKLRRTEVAERQASEKSKQIVAIEGQVEELRVDRERSAALIMDLTTRLKEATNKAERAEQDAHSKAAALDKNKIATLEVELEDLKIEKRLAEDRAKSEAKKLLEESESLKQRLDMREMELKNEVFSLETRLEAMRSRAEEASTEGNPGGESTVKLLRQIETLQGQYSQARENWGSIESSLNARLAALEKERDEAVRRESEIRKKAKETGAKARKTEDDLESAMERLSVVEAEARAAKEQTTTLRQQAELAATVSADAQAELERQKLVWDAELAQRIEDERSKWINGSLQHSNLPSRNESPTFMNRKTSAINPSTIYGARKTTRSSTHDLLTLQSFVADRSSSRRSSALPPSTPSAVRSPVDPSPSLSRQASAYSLDPPTPSPYDDTDTVTDADDLPTSASPERTIADFVSHSGAAGPSVQLVERMSAAVRRLESEKAAFKDELARLAGQRDAARDEVVGLMREAEGKRSSDRRGADLEAQLGALRQRYDGALELLGEREEEVEELRGDVVELKRIYRELVERKVGL